MSMLQKMNQRIADNAFRKFSSQDCIIESDSQGPALWDMARKAGITGLAALTLFTAVAPAYAQDIQMPSEQISSVYMDQTNKALAENGVDFLGIGMTGIKVEDNPWVGQFQALKEENTTPLFGNREIKVPYSGQSCVVSFSKGEVSSAYKMSVNLPDGFDIGGYEEMRAVSYCALWGLLASKSFNQHHETESGALPLADVMTALAAAKYDTAAFEGVYELQSALALSALRSDDANMQAVALWQLEALGKVHDYVHSEEGARNISGASIDQLVELSDILVRSSQHSVKDSRLDAARAASTPLADLHAALSESGLEYAARTTKDLAASGLSKEGGYYSEGRKMGCEDIQRFSLRREARAKMICRLFEEHNWVADGDATFVGDFKDYANSVLNPSLSENESALKM